MFQHQHSYLDDDDGESIRRITPSTHHRRRSSTSTSASDNDYGYENDPVNQSRMSVLGPKLTRVSDAPWEGDEPMPEDEGDLDSGFDSASIFSSSNKRGRGDWKFPFSQPRSSSASRPSQDFTPSARDKSGLRMYGNSYASRSVASLSVYSVTSGKDVFAAAIDAPPVPVHVNPSVLAATRKDPRARATSVGASARSSVFSAVSSRSQNSSSGNDAPPVPFPRGFEPVDTIAHPYANPDLSLYRTDTANSGPDDVSLLAPSLSYTNATRSPRSPRSPLTPTAHPSVISTPMPASPGALHGLAMNGGWVPGSSIGQAYSLISLEQAQAQQRAKSAALQNAAESPSATTFPASTLPFDQALAERDRQRKASVSTMDTGMSDSPADPNQGSSAFGPPTQKAVKPRRSGFMKLLRSGSKDKDVVASPVDSSHPPPLPTAPSRPVITHGTRQPTLSAPERWQPGYSSGLGSSVAPPTDSIPALPPLVSTVKRVPPPSLSVVMPSSSATKPSTKPVASARSFTLDVQSSPVHPETPPRSAPPKVGTYETPALSLRPVSALFSGLPQDMFTRPNGSPASPMSNSITPRADEIETWRATVADLEREVRELRAQMAEMRRLAALGVCERCGGGLAHTSSENSVATIGGTDSSGALSSVSSLGTFGGPEGHHPQHTKHSPLAKSPLSQSQLLSPHHHAQGSCDVDRTPSSTLEAQRREGSSVLNRPRALTGGRDRATFAGMWRD